MNTTGEEAAPPGAGTARSGRGFAYAGVGAGLGVSIWANVAHAATRPAGIPVDQGWRPETGAVAIAGFWPLILFLALEILTRTVWAGGRGVVVARVGVAVVASGAAIESYLHLHALLVHYGEPAFPAAIGPLAIDGLMAVSAAALLTSVPRTTGPAQETRTTGQAGHVPAGDVPVGPVTAPDGPRVASRGGGSKTTGRTRPAAGSTGERVARLRAEDPGLSVAQIARRLGVTDRTVRRHLAATTATASTDTTAETGPETEGEAGSGWRREAAEAARTARTARTRT